MRRISGDPAFRDLFSLTRCGVTEYGTPVHIHGATTETWQRCQCGARFAEMVDGKLVLHRVDN